MNRALLLASAWLMVVAGACADFDDSYARYCALRGDCDGGVDAGEHDAGSVDSGILDSGHPDAGNPCFNGVKDPAEGDIDCGGSCAAQCGADGGCSMDSDCSSGLCHSARMHCAANACGDGRQNGQETDIDCGGGGSCATCANYQVCGNAADCASDNCSSAECAPYGLEWNYGFLLHCSRGNARAATIGDRVYIGGNTGTCDTTVSDPTGLIESSSAEAPSWNVEPSMLVYAREGGAFLSGPAGRLYALGGFNDSQTTAQFSMVQSAVPGAFYNATGMAGRRAFFASTSLPDGRLFVAGGHNTDVTTTVNAINTTEFFFPDAGAPDGGYWVAGSPLGTFRAGAAAATTADGRILVMGGRLKLSDTTQLATIEQFPSDGGAPSSHPPMPVARAFFGLTRGADERVYAVGGTIDGGPSNRVDAFDSAANKWSVVTPLPDPRSGAAVVVGPDLRLWVIGGQAGAAQQYTYTVYKYGPELTANPTNAAASTQVLVYGNGYPPTTRVVANFDGVNGTALGSLVTDSIGRLPNNMSTGLLVTVPAGTPSGTHYIYLRDVKSNYPVRVKITVP